MISKQKNEIEQLRGDLKSKDAELETKKTELKKSYEILEKGKNKLKDLD
jgi:chromosome segregation ATPase